MENSVFFSELASEEIKPSLRLARYRLLASEFNLNEKEKSLVEIACPFCDSAEVAESNLVKSEMTYVRCRDCESLYVSARPSATALVRYYRESAARRYWVENIYEPTLKVRTKKALEPLADWLEVSMLEWQAGVAMNSSTLGLVRPTSYGFYKILSEKKFNVTEIEPMYPGAKVKQPTVDSYDSLFFEDAISNAFSPRDLLKDNWSKLKKGGLAFLTMPLATGFDILTLKENSDSVNAPDRLNLPSYEIIQKFLQTLPGAVVLEFSTPGVLDLQNVFEAKLKQGVKLDPFVQYLYDHRNTQQFIVDFQKFLQSYGLSSQARIVLKKN